MVRRFFNSETGIWRFFGCVGEVVMLSLAWTLCSIPLVTAGAASTALYDTVVHVMRRRETDMFSRFFGTFRRELKTSVLSLLLWAAVAAVPVLLYGMRVRALPEEQPLTALSVVFFLLLCLILCVLCWLFPLLSRFTFGFADLNRTAVRIALGNVLRSAAMTLFFVGGIALILRNYFSIFFVPGLAAWLSSYLIEPVFSRYESQTPGQPESE